MLKCSKEAFARCPTSHLCGSREESTFVEGSECDKFNQAVAHQPQTNADRIRAMSDEELADFIFEAPAVPCDEKISAMMKKNNCDDCRACIMEWLRQPAKEDA